MDTGGIALGGLHNALARSSRHEKGEETVRHFLIVLMGIVLISGTILAQGGRTPLAEQEEKEKDPLDLGKIVVTATKTEKMLKDLGGGITVITREDIRESNAKSVSGLLRTVTGIDMQDEGAFGHKARLNMRGLQGRYGSQHVLVLQDGRPVNEEYLGDVDFRLLPVDNIERIEIVRGPGSALYGANAMGGVINIITKTGEKEPFAQIQTSGGSHNTQWYKAQYGARTGNFHHFTTLGYHYTDGYLKNTDGTDKDWHSGHFTGKLGYEFADDSDLTFSFGYTRGVGTKEDFEEEKTVDYEDLAYSLNWNPDKEARLLARIYRNGFDQDLAWNSGFTGEYDQFTLGSLVQQSYRLGTTHLLTTGIDLKIEDVDILEAGGKVEELLTTTAFYLQDEIDVTKALSLTLGSRYDSKSEFGGEFSPRAGMLYKLTEITSFYASSSKGWRAPTPSDMFLPRTTYFGMTFEGNPDLEPETMWSYELGAKHVFGGKALGEITLYKNDIKDAWDFMQDPDTIYRPNNVTQVETYGVEGKLLYDISKNLAGQINYSYTQPKYKKYDPDPTIEGNRLEDILKHSGGLGLRYTSEGGSVFNVYARYGGDRFTDPENSPDGKLSSFTVTNVGAYLPVTKETGITVSILNLFDKEYRETIHYKQPGRTVFVGIRAEF